MMGNRQGGNPLDAIEIDDSDDGNSVIVISMHDTDSNHEGDDHTMTGDGPMQDRLPPQRTDSPEVIDLLSSSSSSCLSSSSFVGDDTGRKVASPLPRTPTTTTLGKRVPRNTPESSHSMSSSRQSQPYTVARKRFSSSSSAVASKPEMGRCPLCQQEFLLEDLSSHVAACSAVASKPETGRCPLCQQEFLLDDLPSHVAACCSSPSRATRPQEELHQRELTFDDDDDDEEEDEWDQKPPATSTAPHTARPLTTTKEDAEDSIGLMRSPGGHSSLPRDDEEPSTPLCVDVGHKADDFPKRIRHHVEKTLTKIRTKRMETKNTLWRKAIRDKNKMMHHHLQRPQQPFLNYAPLPEEPEVTVLQSAYLHEPDYPLPSREDHTALHTKHLASKKALEHEVDDLNNKEQKPPTPKFDAAELSSDDSSTSSEKDLTPNQIKYKTQIDMFRNPDQVGVGAELDEQDDDIDKVLQSITATSLDPSQSRKYLSIILQVSLDHVEERWKILHPVPEPPKTYATLYEKVNSTYRSLFCRSCMVIDCNYHGNQGEERPADIELELLHRAQDAKLFERKLPSKRQMYCVPVGTNPFEEDIPDVAARQKIVLPPVTMQGWENKTLSETEMGICQRLYQVYRGDVARVSSISRIPEEVIRAQCHLDTVSFAYKLPNEWFRGNKKRPIPEWAKDPEKNNVRRPFAKPCSHKGICTEDNCLCIQNRYFCTLRCLWGRFSPNFFPGCICKKQCRANCPCFIANRECDPEVCGCDTCTHPEHQRVTGEEGGQQCRNDEMSMRRHAHLLVGKSSVHGFGCFAKTAIQKNEVIDEYIGELITHNEAEQRGEELEGKNLSLYLFDLGNDYAIDARCKGNKTRFINHSDHPNVGTRLKIVIGEYHIQFYALKHIPAEAELFFDYGRKFFKKQNETVAGENLFLTPTKKARTKSKRR